MSDLAKLLEAEGITLTNYSMGKYQLLCPKGFCNAQDEHGEPEATLVLEIVTPDFAHWKCEHCLWTDHAGQRPEPAAPKPQSKKPEIERIFAAFAAKGITKAIAEEKFNAPCAPASDLYIVGSNHDKLILRNCGFNATSIPTAASDQEDDYMASIIDLVQAAPRILLALPSTPSGERLRVQLAKRIGAAKCMDIRFLDGTAAATYLNRGEDELCNDLNLAKPYPIAGLYEVLDFENQLFDYYDNGMASGVSTGWDNLDRYYTVMGGELTVVTGIPNHGKSEFVDALTVNLAEREDWKFAVFSPENGKEQHTTKLIEKRVQMPADPNNENRMSRDTFASGAMWVQEHYFFIVADALLNVDDEDTNENEITPTLDWIIAKAKDAILRHGIKGVIIDPWNEIDQKRGAASETDYTSRALSKLKRFAKNHGIHVWLIAHPRSMMPDKKTGILPVPSLYDIAGSAHFVNKMDNGIVIHRSEDITDATEVHIKKVRFKHVGKRGITTLQYVRDSGRYLVPENPDAVYSMAGPNERAFKPKKKRKKKDAPLLETVDGVENEQE